MDGGFRPNSTFLRSNFGSALTSWHKRMKPDSVWRLILSVSEINSELAATQGQYVGWVCLLCTPLPVWGIVTYLIALSNSCDLLFVSSRPFGEPLGLFCGRIPLSAPFPLWFYGHLTNRVCHFPVPYSSVLLSSIAENQSSLQGHDKHANEASGCS